jgi:hypothetical protein
MHVEIDYRGAFDRASALQGADRDGDVVEDAKPFAVIWKGVMRPTGENHRNAARVRMCRRFKRGAGRAVRSLDERIRPWNAELPLFVTREGAGVETVDVVGGVHEQQFVACRATRIVHVVGLDNSVGEYALVKERVLGERKAVTVGKRKAVLGGRPDVKRQANRLTAP